MLVKNGVNTMAGYVNITKLIEKLLATQANIIELECQRDSLLQVKALKRSVLVSEDKQTGHQIFRDSRYGVVTGRTIALQIKVLDNKIKPARHAVSILKGKFKAVRDNYTFWLINTEQYKGHLQQHLKEKTVLISAVQELELLCSMLPLTTPEEAAVKLDSLTQLKEKRTELINCTKRITQLERIINNRQEAAPQFVRTLEEEIARHKAKVAKNDSSKDPLTQKLIKDIGLKNASMEIQYHSAVEAADRVDSDILLAEDKDIQAYILKTQNKIPTTDVSALFDPSKTKSFFDEPTEEELATEPKRKVVI